MGTRMLVGARNIPEETLVLGGLTDPDYIDLFSTSTRGIVDASPEQWARALFEGSSATGRFLAWQLLLRLRLEALSSPDFIAGWRIVDRGEDWIRVEASSWFMTAHCVFRAADGQISFATFVRYDHRVGGPIWALASAIHRKVAPDMVRHGVRLMQRVGQLPQT